MTTNNRSLQEKRMVMKQLQYLAAERAGLVKVNQIQAIRLAIKLYEDTKKENDND